MPEGISKDISEDRLENRPEDSRRSARERLPGTVVCRASPSLALVKYWGKRRRGINIPDTTSVAVTLGGLDTVTRIGFSDDGRDHLVLDNEPRSLQRYRTFFSAMRAAVYRETRRRPYFDVVSENSFPTAAGLASSSSGFAALAYGCNQLTASALPAARLSLLARHGSGSAARSLYGGFTRFRAGASSAEQIGDDSCWPDLRIVVAIVAEEHKPMSTREAMQLSQETSPFYPSWRRKSRNLADEAIEAIRQQDIERLGETVRQSYLRMHSVMFTSAKSIIYWQPTSLGLIVSCGQLRRGGIPAYETLDAGPQVKIVTTAAYVDEICQSLKDSPVRLMVARVGGSPSLIED